MKLVALVPMKGHSERVKGKNLRNFDGKPLCFYILKTLCDVPEIEKVFIDTDSKYIQELVKKEFPETEVLMRPSELQGDMVSMNKIIEYDMNQIEAECYLQTHVTNPLLLPETIQAAYKKYLDGIKQGYDSLFSVNRWQTRLYDKNAQAVNHNPKDLIRTQDLDPLFEENSNMYFFSKKSFMESNARIGKHPMMYEMNAMEAIDIDEEIDFLIAEQLYKFRKDD